MKKRAAILVLIGLACPPTPEDTFAQELEVRVEPAEVVYVNQTSRTNFINDVLIQSVSVINRTDEPVTFTELQLRVGGEERSQVISRIRAETYGGIWEDIIYPPYSDPTYGSQDSITLISRVIPDGVTLSPSRVLAPDTAVMITKQPLLLPFGPVPATIHIRATALDMNGTELVGEATRRVAVYQQENEYIFPVTGRWYLASSSSLRSHHRIRLGHEFALDLIKIGDGGSSFRTDGSTPADYYAFGADVVAVADGTVVEAVDGLPDTEMPKPGESREDFATRVLRQLWIDDPSGQLASGNYIVVRHSDGEYSHYVHLRQGSVSVRESQSVRQGQRIGAVGISGDGYQPHLHFAVTDSSSTSYGQGLPVIFENVRPVPFSSTLDMEPRRLFLAGEFVETISSE